MKAVFSVLINLLLVSTALAQQPVTQSGSPSAGQIGVWQSKGVLGGSGKVNSPNASKPITDLPIVSSGSPVCIYDAPISSPAGYHKLCFGANQGSTGIIEYSAIGGASVQGLNFKVNGTTIPVDVSSVSGGGGGGSGFDLVPEAGQTGGNNFDLVPE